MTLPIFNTTTIIMICLGCSPYFISCNRGKFIKYHPSSNRK